MPGSSNLQIDSASLTTIWVNVPELRQIPKGEIENLEVYLFGDKANHLQPLMPIRWEGKKTANVGNDANKQVLLKQGVDLSLCTHSIDGRTPEEVKINLLLKMEEEENPFDSQDSRQQLPFSVIDIKLSEKTLPDSLKTNKETIAKVFDLLILPREDFSYDFDVYRKIGIVKVNDSLLNLSSLDSCFLTLSPKSALIIRGNKVEDKIILPSTLEAVSLIAVCFVGYSSMLYNLGTWEDEIFDLISQIKPNTEELSRSRQKIDSTKFLDSFHKKIYEIADFSCRSSSLLEFHMSYVTSSLVAQNFFTSFSSISGLDEIHESLLTKLGSCNRLLNHVMDYYQFDHIKRLTPRR